jgi:DHA2 family multidrug resistance protein-like MFS transporter
MTSRITPAAEVQRVDDVADGLPRPRRGWSAVAIWLALLLSVLDATIANVALPTIAGDLGTTPDRSIWVINAYQIAITMTLLPLASLGDIVGFKRVYLVGVTLFVLASLSCTVASGLTELAVSRFVQGLGAAAVMAVNGALVRLTYPKAVLGRGIGYNVLVLAVGSAAGPSVAAAVLSVGSWRWLFAINLPLGIAALVIGFRALPDAAVVARRYDWRKALLSAAAFAALFLGASGLVRGDAPQLPLAELAVGAAIVLVLLRISRGDPAPLVPIDLLRVRTLRLSYATSACSFAAQMIAFVALPFFFLAHFQSGRATVGLLLTPWPLGAAVCAPLAGRLVERVSAGLLGFIGLAATAAGLLLLALIPAGGGYAAIIAATALCGAGFGFFQAPNNRTMLDGAPVARSGAAAGMLAISRLTGQTAGALVVALLFRLVSPASSAPLFLGAALAGFASLISLSRTTGAARSA